MLKRIATLALALVLAAPGMAFAAGAGGGTHTTTYTNSTSTSTSTSTSSTAQTSYQTVDKGTVWESSTVHGYVVNTANNGYADLTYTSVVSGYVGAGSSYSEILTANFGSPQNYLYYNLGGQTGTISPGGTLGFDPVDVYHRLVSGRGSVSVDRVTLSSSSSSVVNLGSSSNTTVSTSQSQSTQLSTQVTSQDQEIKVGDFVIGVNTVVNTNVNTNTNTNTNYDYATMVSNYQGNAVTNVYSGYGSCFVSPIVLDFSGTGRLDASAGDWKPHQGLKGKNLVLFDFHGNNQPLLMEWVGPKAGLLVEPKADGTIDGSCLFGTQGGFDNGYEKLSVRDKNNDGKISGAELNNLSVWIDKNSNGSVDAGELQTVQTLKISELDLRHRGFRSSYVIDGQRQTMWDWWPSAMNVRKMKVATSR